MTEKDKEKGEADVYEQIREDLAGMVGKTKFGENDLKNLIYREVIQILEPLECRGKYKGNAHHLTQDITEKVASAIMERIELPERGKEIEEMRKSPM